MTLLFFHGRKYMLNINSFGIIGGDKRQLFCARSAADDGFGVFLAGFGKCENTLGLKNTDIKTAVENADALIFPLPISKDGETVNAPFADKPILFGELKERIKKDQPVFCGMNGKLGSDALSGLKTFCYSSREEFAAANAVPTAEGAIEIAMHEYAGTLSGSDVLIIGYGKIGRVLSMMLRGIGARVSVSARQLKDLELIKAAGMNAEHTARIRGRYDIIFNTVPALILDSRTLAKCASDALVIDLASLPGGADDKAAERMSIKVIHALSLPGKAAPKTAGIIIKNAVYNIIEEEDL